MNFYDIHEIRQLLLTNGFHFSKAKGQNFLTERWVPERIVEEAKINSNDYVLEIGPGIGTLTAQIAASAKKVLSIELDRRLIPILNITLADFDNVEIIQGDILKTNLVQLVQQHLCLENTSVCANLPYNITSPLLSFLTESRLFRNMTVMVQREVAQRICAKPLTSAYGAFSIYINYYTEPRILFDVPPSCFIPQPKVFSSVVSLSRRDTLPNVEDEKLFSNLYALLFHKGGKP